MFRTLELLAPSEIEQLRALAAASQFVDGRISNPHNKAKQNLQLHEAGAYQQSSQLLLAAINRSPEFAEFAFPAMVAPPLLTKYGTGHRYGAHADAAYLQTAAGALRSDLSCTIFLNDPASYEGGALHVRLGDGSVRFKLAPGHAILYPSNTLHEVEPVTSGERLVAITFIQSLIPDPFERTMLFELNEVAALEGLKMDPESFSRLQYVQAGLMRYWGDKP